MGVKIYKSNIVCELKKDAKNKSIFRDYKKRCKKRCKKKMQQYYAKMVQKIYRINLNVYFFYILIVYKSING